MYAQMIPFLLPSWSASSLSTKKQMARNTNNNFSSLLNFFDALLSVFLCVSIRWLKIGSKKCLFVLHTEWLSICMYAVPVWESLKYYDALTLKFIKWTTFTRPRFIAFLVINYFNEDKFD